MAKEIAVSPKVEKKNTASFSFRNSDMMKKIFGDIEAGETISITLTGKVTSFSMHESKDWNDSSVGLDITSIKASSKKQEDNKKELNDMMED